VLTSQPTIVPESKSQYIFSFGGSGGGLKGVEANELLIFKFIIESDRIKQKIPMNAKTFFSVILDFINFMLIVLVKIKYLNVSQAPTCKKKK